MGSGPAVVLLHGFPENGTLWRNVWDTLSSSYTLFIPDLPGSGKSAREKETSMQDMAECVKAMLDAEHVAEAVIAGHSMGGYAALAFAFSYPEMVAGVSLVHSTPAADDEEKRKTRIKSIELIQKGGKKAFISQMVPNLFSTVSRERLSSIINNLVDEGVNMEDESLVNFYRAMLGREDYSDRLESAGFPMQWIIGTEDNLIPYKRILKHCHQSAVNFVSFYHDCGHMGMFEAPEQLEEDLNDFIEYCHYHRDTAA
jgi:pimeloyl-ACP methyl ester carboxylesterase